MNNDKLFIFYFYFVGWSCISLGIHVDLSLPNLEVHLPFGFIRIGYDNNDIPNNPLTENEKKKIMEKRTYSLT